ncbi:MAG: T9SS type A sorting domain-containing protein, partial [Bacteroidota bacterium]
IAGVAGEYRFLVEGQESFPLGEDLYLEDHLEQNLVDLRSDPEYSFTASAGFDPDRFMIRIGNPAGEKEEEPMQGIGISTEQNRIIFHGLENCTLITPVCLFDMKGNLVLSAHVDTFHPAIETDLPAGIFIVKLTCSEGSVSSKIYIESTTN